MEILADILFSASSLYHNEILYLSIALTYIWMKAFAKKLSTFIQQLPKQTTSIIIYISIATSVLFFSNIFIMNNDINIYLRIFNLLFVYIIYFGLLYILYDVSNQYFKLLDMRQVSTIKNMIHSYVDKQEQSLLEFKKIKHDITDSFQLLSNLLNENKIEEASAYLDSKISSIHSIHQIYQFTGNIYIDMLLSDFITTYEDIKFDISSIGFQLYHIEVDEILTIFLNLLKNATEATAKSNERNKVIHLKIRGGETKLFIEIANPYNGIHLHNLMTMKSDTNNHGLGLKIINDIVRMHHGIMNIDTQDKVFIVKIILH